MNSKAIRFNLFFWLIYFAYEWLGRASIGDEYYRYLITALALVPLTFLASILTMHVLVKNYFLKGKKSEFWIYFAISVCVFALLRRSFVYFYVYPNYLPHALSEMPYIYWPKLLVEAVNIYLIVALYTLFHFVRELYNQRKISFELQRDKIETELKLLKSQVHPHFIFNTLNNIYSLAIHGNPMTKDLIYRLSAFLSYSLYDGSKDTIPLKQELDYIMHYIELEKIRYEEGLDISVNVFQEVEGFKISPMLLLPLVENAFKHGPNHLIKNNWIRLDFTVWDQWLTFKIENSMHGYNFKTLSKNGGLGLDNLQKRLDILYPSTHSLKLLKQEDSYLVILKLKSF
ncbi:histidine kinase [uncultured Croceitalea sp.]|uniref:sensor histidine kinase n=1 Tax=uncultured Croceitalea sp. TaxID=1798908 RepID=UPI003305E1A5